MLTLHSHITLYVMYIHCIVLHFIFQLIFYGYFFKFSFGWVLSRNNTVKCSSLYQHYIRHERTPEEKHRRSDSFLTWKNPKSLTGFEPQRWGASDYRSKTLTTRSRRPRYFFNYLGNRLWFCVLCGKLSTVWSSDAKQ